MRGVGAQIKRGLHRDYLNRSEELAGGPRTHRHRSNARAPLDLARAACMRVRRIRADTPHNQALKSVLVLLLRHGEVATPRRDALRRLCRTSTAVTLVAPTSIRWGDLTYHRANATYRLLLGVCEMIVRGLLPTQDNGTAKLASWLSDDAMSGLYERFLREYYALHHPELSPGASTVDWDLDESDRPRLATSADAHRRNAPARWTHPHHRREVLQPVSADRAIRQADNPFASPVPNPCLRRRTRTPVMTAP